MGHNKDAQDFSVLKLVQFLVLAVHLLHLLLGRSTDLGRNGGVAMHVQLGLAERIPLNAVKRKAMIRNTSSRDGVMLPYSSSWSSIEVSARRYTAAKS